MRERIVSLPWNGMSNKGAPDCGRYARDDVLFAVGVRGEVEQLAEEEVEKELTEVTGWLEQLARLEEKEVEEESGSSVHGSETCLREY